MKTFKNIKLSLEILTKIILFSLSGLFFFCSGNNPFADIPYRGDHLPGTSQPVWMDTEPNDSIYQATGSQVNLDNKGVISSAGDLDTYSYTGNTGDVYTATIQLPAGGKYGLKILDSNGAIITQTASNSITWTLAYSGVFYIQVYSVDGSFVSSSPYTVTLTSTPMGTVSTPVLSIGSGTYTGAQTVSVSSTTAGSVFYFTTNGTIPDCSGSGTLYDPVAKIVVVSSLTLKVIGCAAGFTNSQIAMASYVITGTVSVPQFLLFGGTFGADQSVGLTVATAGANICYTTNGTQPTCDATAACVNGNSYTVAVGVTAAAGTTSNVTINAIGCSLGYANSTTSTSTYIIDKTPPTQSTMTATTAGSSQINLTWSASTDDITTGANIVYQICQSTAAGGCNTFAVSQTVTGATSLNVTTLNANTAYYFKIRAADSAGNTGPASTEVTATTNSLGVVNNPSYSITAGTYGTNQSVAITTTPTGSTICYTTDGITIPSCNATAACTSGTTYTSSVPITATAGSTTSVTLKAMACKLGYTNSGVSSATYTIDKTPPSTVTGLFANSLTTTSASLLWTAATDNLPGNLTYQVCAGAVAGFCSDANFPVFQTSAAGVTAMTVTGLTPSSGYYFKIRARDAAGNVGFVSNENYTSTFIGATPTYSLVGGIFNVDQTISFTTTTPVPYNICYTTNGTTPTCNAPSYACINGTIGSSYTTVTGAGATTTTVLKTIVCKADYVDSAVASSTYIVDHVPPSQVTGVVTSKTATTLTASWTAAPDDITNAANMVYQVCVSTTNGGCNTFTISGTSAAGQTTVSLPAPAGTYYGKIRAKDQAGNIGTPSVQVIF